MSKLQILRKLFFALPLKEANFEIRKFEANEPAQKRLELIAKTVVHGYNMAIEVGLSQDLLVSREMIENELMGFYNEGVGMGLYTLDLISIGKKDRFWNFVKGPGKNHEYMSYIGAGIACGVFLNRPFEKFIKKASPTSGLLILNGFGFYYAYFKPDKIFKQNYIPAGVRKDAFFIECYDNGIGRALWFYNAANPQKIAEKVALFSKNRQSAIWAGVGLAATYAGGVPAEKIKLLKTLSGEFHISLGEGSLLACHTRDVADNPHDNDSTERILTGRSAKECCRFAIEANVRLQNQRFIDGKHSLQIFFEDIREWLKNSTHSYSNQVKHEELVAD